ncbi:MULTISPECIES: CaiB/BaiF CoA-transferase family protein [unclassified Pseudofrankia]|uniref:CaiB/BaiF CoA transferase family protein n=1 Tax=unclassified Pseudofrankia TaxID=2994372 RepID=UPI0008D92903|nr:MULTISPECIES: CoA transferase [unclassified Pseudofrankia]MDT3445794.1 CoA transferase [Pseudofrankia sp. BMG5.37]OHV62796.1 carnitine dehydratase [Pseudofrankia sp. BMG5.36]
MPDQLSYDLLAGVKVVEVAAWLFAPTCGAVLGDWGADVIKIEPTTGGGDPYRGFFRTSAVSPTIELANRGKRSVALDLSTTAGHEALLRLVADADVFVTSLQPSSRFRLRIEADDIRAANPSIIYIRASGYGTRGPDAETPGFDAAAAWARTGIAQFLTAPDAPAPTGPPGGIGDCVGGLSGAGAVAAALFKRERTGTPSEIDVSLLAGGLWMNATILMMEANAGPEGSLMRGQDRRAPRNPLSNPYRCKDGRWLHLVVIQPDPYWRSFCEHIGRPELIDDPRFVDFHARMANNVELVDLLDEVFAVRTLDEWRDALATFDGVWDALQTPAEVVRDPQVLANGYLLPGEEPGPPLSTIASPAQFDGHALTALRRAPEHGQHTEEVLLEYGYSWDDLAALKDQGAII